MKVPNNFIATQYMSNVTPLTPKPRLRNSFFYLLLGTTHLKGQTKVRTKGTQTKTQNKSKLNNIIMKDLLEQSWWRSLLHVRWLLKPHYLPIYIGRDHSIVPLYQ
jgi:hypothetical protein